MFIVGQRRPDSALRERGYHFFSSVKMSKIIFQMHKYVVSLNIICSGKRPKGERPGGERPSLFVFTLFFVGIGAGLL